MAFKEPVNGLYKMSEEPKLALTNHAFKRASIFGFLQPNSIFNDEIVKKRPPIRLYMASIESGQNFTFLVAI